MQLPTTIEEISADWVTRALQERHPGVTCTSATVDRVIWGSATKAKLILEYDDAGQAAGLPASMYVKGGLGGPMQQLAGAGYFKEVRFFRELAPELPVSVPTCYFAGSDDDLNEALLLLEDLDAEGATFGRAANPVSVDTAAAVLEMQAGYHAHWWDSPTLHELGWLGGGQLRDVMEILLAPEHWDAFLELRSEVVPEAVRDRDAVVRSLQAMWELDQLGPHCLLHGDTHLDNMYFGPDGAPGLLDWQTVQRGPWVHDVSYSIIGMLDIGDRRAHERNLLSHYLDRLRSLGVDALSLDDAFLYYRRHVWHGFLWWLTPVEMQPDETSRIVGGRFATAAMDLESLATMP